jgi:hypothetical protein
MEVLRLGMEPERRRKRERGQGCHSKDFMHKLCLYSQRWEGSL